MKKYFLLGVITAVFTSTVAYAAPKPIPNVDVIFKKVCNSSTSICKRSFAYKQTDANGEFSVSGLDNELYDIYYGNESLPPIAKITPTNGKITGKIYVDIYDQAEQVKPNTPVKKETSTPTSSTTTTSKSATFVYGVWDKEHLDKLKTVLVSEKVLDAAVSIKSLEDVRNGVKAFQKKYGIDQTGTLGPTTIKKLNSLVK